MARRRMLWGGLIAASVAVASVAIAAAVAEATSPERPVRAYLDALAADDLATAAALAGLDARDLERLGGMPAGDAGTPDVVQIIDTVEVSSDERIVIARYGERGVDVAEVAFALEPTTLGPFRGWRLASPPVEGVVVAADRHDEVVVNGERHRAVVAGEATTVPGFVPARLEIGIASPYLDGETARARVGTASAADPIVIAVTPSQRLQRLVDREVAAFLEECTQQRVLQPAGCPFGIAVPDRLVEEPQWRVGVPAVVEVVPGRRTGEWALEGGTTMRISLTVQRLSDGVIEERDEAVVARISGSLVLDDDAVRLTIAPPEE